MLVAGGVRPTGKSTSVSGSCRARRACRACRENRARGRGEAAWARECGDFLSWLRVGETICDVASARPLPSRADIADQIIRKVKILNNALTEGICMPTKNTMASFYIAFETVAADTQVQSNS